MTGSSAVSQTDVARLDAHEIQPEVYEELPEISDEEFAAATLIGGHAGGDGPADLVHIDADVVARFRALVPDWRSRINETLRRALGL